MWHPPRFPPRLLVRFADKYSGMCRAEFAAVVELLGQRSGTGECAVLDAQDREPFVHVSGLSSLAHCQALCARAMLTQQVFEVYGKRERHWPASC